MATARRIPSPQERPSHLWGLESWLDCWAWILSAIGILATALTYFVGVGSAYTVMRFDGPPLILLFVHLQLFVGIILSIAVFLVFRWLAESLRLLKKLACLDISGRISDSRREPTALWICSACQNPTYNEVACEHCGAKFE